VQRVFFKGHGGIVFGPRCVCCGADAGGATLGCNPATRAARAMRVLPMLVPVCHDCTAHALPSPRGTTLPGAFVIVGLVLLVFGLVGRSGPFSATVLWLAGVILTISFAAMAFGRMRMSHLRKHGHHPGFEVTANRTGLLLDSSNATLIEDVLERNAHGEHRGTVESWRYRDPRLPPARLHDGPK
jgi:hypothetical protein